MPLTITIPGKELYDPAANKFIIIKEKTIQLEHSLLSIARWESKWHKPFLSRDEKTKEEMLDYVRCMTLTQNVDPKAYYALGRSNMEKILEYIQDPSTATTIKKRDMRPSREIITNELVYYWMTALNIPFDPCEKWHFQRLMTLIEVCSIKQQPSKKIPHGEAARQRASLNAARRAKYGTRG